MTVGDGAIVRRDVSEATKRSVVDEANGCLYCGDQFAPLVVDHRRPLSRGGGNERRNLAAACVACNSQKRAMLLHEWRGFRKANGMPWPPVASHATDPVHFCDTCSQCRSIYWKIEAEFGLVEPEHGFITAPTGLQWKRDGLVAYYRCAFGHAWHCWWGRSVAKGYYSDCECEYCQTNRDDNGDKTYTRPPRYAEIPADFRAALVALGVLPGGGDRRVGLGPFLTGGGDVDAS